MGEPIRACGGNDYKLEQLHCYTATLLHCYTATLLPATLAKLHPMLNATLLKCYVGDVVPAPDPIKLDDGPEYEVDAISHY